MPQHSPECANKHKIFIIIKKYLRASVSIGGEHWRKKPQNFSDITRSDIKYLYLFIFRHPFFIISVQLCGIFMIIIFVTANFEVEKNYSERRGKNVIFYDKNVSF